MHPFFRGLLFASVAPFLAIPPAILTAVPAQAQPADISFDSFHDQLTNYGDWLYSDRWGEVWRPWQQDQNPDWRPYSAGHWVYTDEYGWTWISDEGPWSDIAYHYGRWVFDPDDGWLWLTGYVWSPAWVVWRSAGPNVGWMPMPPDDAFLGNGGVSVNVNFGDWGDTGGFYGYARWYGPRFDENRFGSLWTFVPSVHVADPAYRNYVVPRPQVVNIVRVSRNVTNYTVINNVIVNRSVNVTMVQGAGGRPLAPVHANAVLHSTRWIAPVNRGQQIQAQMRQIHPRGNGMASSAPQPTAQQIRGLSTRPVPARGSVTGGAPHHLFSQANVTQIQARGAQGATPRPPAVAGNPGVQRPPGGALPQRDHGPSAANDGQRPVPARPASGEAQRPVRENTPRGPLDRAPNAPIANHPNPGAALHDDRRALQEQHDRASQPPPRPEPAEARPSRPVEAVRPPPPRQVPPPRPVAPRPAHPQGDHGAAKPEHHGEDHKQER